MTWKNEQEKEALIKKLHNPSEKVVCPTCEIEIIYEPRGNSEIAKCPSCGSFAGRRGI